jgi:hypothetical protein
MDEYLLHYVQEDKMNRLDLLDSTQLNYNLHKISVNGYSPFDLMNGQQPTTPYFMTQGYYGMNTPIVGFVKSWKDRLEITCTRLTVVTY